MKEVAQTVISLYLCAPPLLQKRGEKGEEQIYRHSKEKQLQAQRALSHVARAVVVGLVARVAHQTNAMLDLTST